jgi:hypothetical protein
MKNSSWKDYAEIAGIAAIVASLIFVGLQMRQDRVIAVASVQAAFLESFVEIRSGINQNAEIWDRGLAGSDLTGADAVVFHNLAASLRRQAIMQSDQLERLGQNGDFPIIQFADLIRQYPGFEQEMANEDARVRIQLTASSTPLRSGPI